jgi:alpha-tubulin suppressor-like RCC1 family protein
MKDENIKSISCFGSSNMVLKNNGELFVFGSNYFGKKN